MKRWLVVIPTLGDSPYFDEAVASVRALGEDICVRVVAPADQHGALAVRVPEAALVADQRGGLYAALRQATEDAGRFDGVTWLNDDDRLIARGSRVALGTIDQGAELVFGQVGLMDAKGAKLGWLPVCRRGADLARLLSRGIVALAQPGTWLSGALWSRLGGLDASYHLAGDLDLFWRAASSGARVVHVSKAVARFRLRSGQLSQQVAHAQEEKRRALRQAIPSSAWAARWRFAVGNCGVYLDRIRRHGFASMDTIYRRGGGYGQ